MRTHDPFGTCRNCGCHIMWVKTKAGKNMPVRPYDDQLPQARSRSEGKGEDSYAGRRGRMC